jgi:hypothetical protein
MSWSPPRLITPLLVGRCSTTQLAAVNSVFLLHLHSLPPTAVLRSMILEMVWIIMRLMSIFASSFAIQMRSDWLKLVLTINEKAEHALNEHFLLLSNDHVILLCYRLCFHINSSTMKVCSKHVRDP